MRQLVIVVMVLGACGPTGGSGQGGAAGGAGSGGAAGRAGSGGAAGGAGAAGSAGAAGRAGSGGAPQCVGNDQCSAPTGVCSGGRCVQCAVNTDCPMTAPLCSDGTCMASCAGAAVAGTLSRGPVDIIWVVDQSGSMNQETQYVQQKLNDFVGMIDASGLDYHVVMIAAPTGTNLICVPPPLGGMDCGNGPRFRLVPQRVGSHNGPQLAVTQYPLYSDFLRPDAVKHFVFVTDDESTWTAMQFTMEVGALAPAGIFMGHKVHGIYAYGTPPDGCDGPFGAGAAEGTVYTQLITQTGGARGVICTGDWSQVFTEITQSVITGAMITCDLAIPAPPMGQTLDPARVNVRYLPAGVTPGRQIVRVDSAAACGTTGGWHYDDNAAPTKILLCPATCTEVQGDPMASLQVEFGCSSVIGKPQ